MFLQIFNTFFLFSKILNLFHHHPQLFEHFAGMTSSPFSLLYYGGIEYNSKLRVTEYNCMNTDCLAFTFDRKLFMG